MQVGLNTNESIWWVGRQNGCRHHRPRAKTRTPPAMVQRLGLLAAVTRCVGVSSPAATHLLASGGDAAPQARRLWLLASDEMCGVSSPAMHLLVVSGSGGASPHRWRRRRDAQ
ncbi:hypothetical protein GUJ93_ZPchr0013g36469 [Zizania palustris]|uniref:Uncharacterized protein n=1 Tax=Zizania palustris TaxID=103762 RepID=A0A8J6C2C6_ZIZPA|nr:hypothetical protein GUJ93_ZPchr0013g36469 [Zizania palustris]